MADRPIIFSAPMVRALLDGRKTQTRRVLKPLPRRTIFFDPKTAVLDQFQEPPYAPGDRLWVREAWRIGAWHGGNATVAVDYCNGPRKEWLDVEDGYMLHRLIDQSRADAVKAGMPLRDSCYEYSWSPGRSPCRWRSPIHMPRRASRLTLLVTDVRVQRLQEISEADARAEGIEPLKSGRGYYDPTVSHDQSRSIVRFGQYYSLATHAFSALWDSIHGPDAWDANPWVAAISFTVHRCNIDTMEEGTW